MGNHPMDVNTNTRIRWEKIKNLPEVRSLNGKKILDLGAGLGFFSVKFSELGADVLAVDVDKRALDYLSKVHNIQTQHVDIENGDLPEKVFDMVFIGELLEHIVNPQVLFSKVKQVLSPSGIVLITTPSLEGALSHTKGKSLGHYEGPEKHERDGFYLEELKNIFSSAGIEMIYHTFSVYMLAELFMQLTKVGYFQEDNKYHSQSDILNVVNSARYKSLNFIYPILLFFFNFEDLLCSRLKVKGHCHIVVARRI